MNDYTLGNYITALRESNGLSQFQLGKLLGVTDKAVSKWETGAARPRMQYCEKMAYVFGVTLDELLMHQPKNSPFEDERNKHEEALWQKVRDRLFEVYGDKPPANLVHRLDSEEMTFRGKSIIERMELASEILEYARSRKQYARFASGSARTLTGWLMGISDINPIKPHWFCKRCKRLEFSSAAQNGWDLPPKQCECGNEMERDGWNIPFIPSLYDVEIRYNSMYLYTSKAFREELINDLVKIHPGISQIIRFKINDRMFVEHDPDAVLRYILVPDGIPVPAVLAGGKKELTFKEEKSIITPCINLNIGVRDDQACYYETWEKKGLKSPLDLKDPNLVSKIYRAMKMISGDWDRITRKMQIVAGDLNLETVAMEDLIRIVAICFSVRYWQVAKPYFDAHQVDLRSVPVTRDGIWELVASHMGDYLHDGSGFPQKVMTEIYYGTFIYKGDRSKPLYSISDHTESMLKDMGVDDTYIEILKQITVTTTRESAVGFLLDYMRRVMIVPSFTEDL